VKRILSIYHVDDYANDANVLFMILFYGINLQLTGRQTSYYFSNWKVNKYINFDTELVI
jgi:hypothetical protein